ncbi:MAG: hypothetical protein K2X35_18595 [Bryobacteraceae bacterium]|nr:hypothetical protein [Bryobacteraceae bacterium]
MWTLAPRELPRFPMEHVTRPVRSVQPVPAGAVVSLALVAWAWMAPSSGFATTLAAGMGIGLSLILIGVRALTRHTRS